MHTIGIDNHNLTYTVRYSQRRTIGIKVVAVDRLEIAAPVGYPLIAIEKLLRNKSTWILTQLTRLARVAAIPPTAGLEPGSRLLWLGRALTLAVLPATSARPRVDLSADQITVHLSPTLLQIQATALTTVLRQWYIRSARELLTKRTAHWAGKIGVRPQRIFIREQKSRWGSCSSRGNINYNWRIVMAPLAIVDYLVIHELCHIKIPNHSSSFWLLVGQSCPAFKECRKWLKDHGQLIFRLLAAD